MKKNDFIIVGVLVALMFCWMRFFPIIQEKYFPQPEQPVVEQEVVEAGKEVITEENVNTPEAVPAEAVPVAVVEEQLPEGPEQFLQLENDHVLLEISSYGGVIVSATIKEYPALNEPDSAPIVLDFKSVPALKYSGLNLLNGTLEKNGDAIVYSDSVDGMSFKRTISLEGEYQLVVEDKFFNGSDVSWGLPPMRISTGSISSPKGVSATRGIPSLGVDTYYAEGKSIYHWGKKFNGLAKGAKQYTTDSNLIEVTPIDWIAVKNKFFTQIVSPRQTADGFDFTVWREENLKTVSETSATVQFGEKIVESNDTLERVFDVYVGPKEYGALKSLGKEQVEVMEFKNTGWFKFMNPIMYPLKLGLLWGLNHFALFGSYGIAIIILTIIVRVIFWPLTHKSTESMKRMQSMQPQIKELQAKYKDNPQQLQQETMKFYKENKINPMGGCLPMFIQIPVFFALYAVLRSAVQLRFSKFLWIKDLSEPENLFAGMIPIIGSINILPLFMAASMLFQQKLTTGSAAATPEQQQQQKMMQIMMPVMMLFFFYGMPSGLVLYWTISNLIMILQLVVKKKAKTEKVTPAFIKKKK